MTCTAMALQSDVKSLACVVEGTVDDADGEDGGDGDAACWLLLCAC